MFGNDAAILDLLVGDDRETKACIDTIQVLRSISNGRQLSPYWFILFVSLIFIYRL